jgi:probable rRNA maturation factor
VRAALRRIVRVVLQREKRVAGEITVVLSDDAQLRELNRRFRKLDRTTDVLSFGYSGNERRIDGDLVISMDRMAEQARRYKVTRGRELARLVVHGLLHLVGHDHHAPGERRIMRRVEVEIMRSIGAEVGEMDRALRRPVRRARAHR